MPTIQTEHARLTLSDERKKFNEAKDYAKILGRGFADISEVAKDSNFRQELIEKRVTCSIDSTHLLELAKQAGWHVIEDDGTWKHIEEKEVKNYLPHKTILVRQDAFDIAAKSEPLSLVGWAHYHGADRLLLHGSYYTGVPIPQFDHPSFTAQEVFVALSNNVQ